MLLSLAERRLGVAERLVRCFPDGDPSRFPFIYGEIRSDVALRLGRPRRLGVNFVGAVGFGGAVCRARGGSATWAWRNKAVVVGAVSVRTSQSAPRYWRRTYCKRSRSRGSSFIPARRPPRRKDRRDVFAWRGPGTNRTHDRGWPHRTNEKSAACA